MKCLFILIFNFLIFVNINLVKSETYSIEAYSNSKVTGDTELPNNTNYRTISFKIHYLTQNMDFFIYQWIF